MKKLALAALLFAAVSALGDTNPCIQPAQRPKALTMHYLGLDSGCTEENGRTCFTLEQIDFWIDIDSQTMLVNCDQLVWEWDSAGMVKLPIAEHVMRSFGEEKDVAATVRLTFGMTTVWGTRTVRIISAPPPEETQTKRRAVRH